ASGDPLLDLVTVPAAEAAQLHAPRHVAGVGEPPHMTPGAAEPLGHLLIGQEAAGHGGRTGSLLGHAAPPIRSLLPGTPSRVTSGFLRTRRRTDTRPACSRRHRATSFACRLMPCCSSPAEVRTTVARFSTRDCLHSSR